MMSRTLRLSDGLSVRALGAGAGEPLVLIHGVGMRAEAWGPQITNLSADYRVIAIDMPGHGESDPLPEDARLADYVAWAVQVVDALDCGPVNLAGHSMGALIAGGVAVERPDLVRRVALLNGVHRRSAPERVAVLARAAEIARGERNIEGPLTRWFASDHPAVRAQVADWLQTISQRAYATAYRAFAEGDGVYADRLGAIRCPALMLTGDGDANSSATMAETMACEAPLGKAVIVNGHRHMVNLTAPEAVTTAMRVWLQRQEVMV